MTITLTVLLIIVAAAVLFAVSIFNNLIQLRNHYKKALALIF